MEEAQLKLSSAANVEINSIQLGTEIAQSLRSNQEAQRAWLAELLFPRVQKIKGDALTPKITGMLTDLSRLNISEILEFVMDDGLLKRAVDKAAQMLEAEGVTYESLSITMALEYAKQLRARLAEFLQLEQSRQRQILGELLFPLVRQMSGDNLAPGVTGMLIDLKVFEVTEILEFLENHRLLKEKVMEAIGILRSSRYSAMHSKETQRKELWESLYPLVKGLSGENLAPRITEMLTDLNVLEVSEIIRFLKNPKLLEDKVLEAIELIETEGSWN